MSGISKILSQNYLYAAEQGHAYAQFTVGLMYENGDGVSKDIDEARKWYRKAADQGHEAAKEALKRLTHNERRNHAKS